MKIGMETATRTPIMATTTQKVGMMITRGIRGLERNVRWMRFKLVPTPFDNDSVLTTAAFSHIMLLNGGVLHGNDKFEYQNR